MNREPFPSSEQTICVPAPAKINLFLHVTGRRADGYHLLESVFVLIDLCDLITLRVHSDVAVTRDAAIEGVPEADDLTLRAARLLQEVTGTTLGVTIGVEKRIPQGGGLGGGSSDAASVLLALNRLWGVRLSRPALATLALRLGADVPFFIGGSAAWVSGIGEQLRPLTIPSMWAALAMPPAKVPTADIFRAPHLTRGTPSEKIAAFAKDHGRNDLEAVAGGMYPPVAVALMALRKTQSAARMSGSGATVFGVYDSEAEARQALTALPPDTSGQVVRTVPYHPLQKWAFADTLQV